MAHGKKSIKSSNPKPCDATSRTSRTDKDSDVTDDYDRPLQCPSHSTRVMNLYCAFCEKPICDKCKTTAHARHSTEVKGNRALVRAANYKRKFIQKMVDSRKISVIPRIKSLIVELSESKTKLHGRVENVIKRYQNYASKHRDKLIAPEEEWVSEIVFKLNKYVKNMDEKIMFLKEQLFDVQASLQLIQSELDSMSHAELLLISNTLRSNLEFIHEPKWPCEEIMVTLKLQTVPDFGSVMFQTDKYSDKNCSVTFDHVMAEPVIYSRVFDTRLPIPKKALADENAKISLASASEMYVSFGEYIVAYTLDSRRYKKASSNIHFTYIMTVRDNIIDISCEQNGHLFYLTHNAVNSITDQRKIRKCFSLTETPSAICVTTDGHKSVFIAFHDAGKIFKYDMKGEILMELSHPDPKMVYRPRHMALNYIGDLFFSDDISNITILDENGIWKGAITRDAKTTSSCGPLRPTGIACSLQRHVFIIDNNATTNVHIFSEDGKYLQTAVFKNLKDAYVLNIDRSGDVWIAFKDGRIRIYRPNFIGDLD
ncbi:uncharacterized protein LOC128549247 [Mercenaria mercenaria]|uniref:uncharacterized protein LOC128549247 n=1 Tax=Mercenaria mercenaria TaxID=6596 RepID=UPI00234F044D|nr:uncharacterized protein LOC128549247 [Mercenaria mercenaria]